MNNQSDDHREWSRGAINVAYKELEQQNKALRELVEFAHLMIARVQSHDMNDYEALISIEEKLKEIGGE